MGLGLVADIGGTNSRFALCEPDSLELIQPEKYPNHQFRSLEEAIRHYLEEVGEKPTRGCLAIAGPVLGDEVSMTNINWSFSTKDLAKNLGFDPLHLTNDFTALAMSVPHEPADNVKQIGEGTARDHFPISVLGPGTGLGVSGLIWSGRRWIPLMGEGGNGRFTAQTDLEIALLEHAQETLEFVKAEHFLSGPGLSFLYQLLLEIEGELYEQISPKEIVQAAKEGTNEQCVHAVEVFCGMLGAFAGDHAMMLGSFGGVYIGGGVAPQLEHLLEESSFRKRFEAKGKFADYVKPIPTYVLLSHSRAALIGAAAILNHPENIHE